jgi:hypothetical protein
MDYQQLGVEDGSTFLVSRLAEPEPARDATSDDARAGVLGATEVSAWFGEAVAAGVTFDILKTILVGLLNNGRASRQRQVGADEIRDAVAWHLATSGYRAVDFHEVRQVPGHGWSVTGEADARPFRALAEPTGQLIHIRIA